jgi:PAS domain S-box-containing protein
VAAPLGIDQLRAALRSAGTGIWEWAIDSDLLTDADLGLEQLGYLPGEVEPTQRAWDTLIHPEDRQANEAAFQRYLRGDRPLYEHRYRILAKGGDWRWFEERGQVVDWDADGRPLRMLGTQTDVTLQMALREVAAEARQRLERAQREVAAAQAASLAKSEFLSRLSHELRTPLNAVLGFTQLMETDPRDPPTSGQGVRLKVIRESGQHLLRMIGDLLDLSRAEGGALVLHTESLAVPALAQACLDMLQPTAAQAGVTLRPDLPAVLAVQADPTRLRQVLLNLLGNAIKYNRRGGTVRLAAALDGAEVCLEVQDSGIGIAADELPMLFDPFWRSPEAWRRHDGAGIGLAVTQTLVQAMGGRITVHSEPGVGSVFRVWLPAAGASASGSASASASAATPAATPAASAAAAVPGGPAGPPGPISRAS